MIDKIEIENYISRKEYLKKYDSYVGYALHIQNNIKRDDYVRLNTGEIVKVIGIKENKINKKAIYYGIYETDWFDSSAVTNFSKNIIDLIEVGDYVNGYKVYTDEILGKYIVVWEEQENYYRKIYLQNIDIKSILAKEQFEKNCFKVVE